MSTRVALYMRVSTTDQHCANQRRDLQAYCQARGWTIVREFADEGVSGAKADRPALSTLRQEARRRAFDAVLVWRLDRAGRSLAHLVALVQEFHDRGITFVSLNEGIDFGTAAGKLQFAVMAALAEFERDRLRERVLAGLARARSEGKRLGRPRRRPAKIAPPGGSVRAAAAIWGVSKTTAGRWITTGYIPAGQNGTVRPTTEPTTPPTAPTGEAREATGEAPGQTTRNRPPLSP